MLGKNQIVVCMWLWFRGSVWKCGCIFCCEGQRKKTYDDNAHIMNDGQKHLQFFLCCMY